MRLPLIALLFSSCLCATGCLVKPGICGPYVAWYPGIHIGEPQILGGDGSTLAKAVVIKNWSGWERVRELELAEAKALAAGPIQSEETIRKSGRVYHAFTIAENDSSPKRTLFFDVSDAVKPAQVK